MTPRQQFYTGLVFGLFFGWCLCIIALTERKA